MKEKRNKKGFTLAELLVVIAIIGVLIAIAIPTFTSALAKAETATQEANARALHAEMIVEYLDSGKVPANAADRTFTEKGTTYVWAYTAGDDTATVTVTPSSGTSTDYTFAVTLGGNTITSSP